MHKRAARIKNLRNLAVSEGAVHGGRLAGTRPSRPTAATVACGGGTGPLCPPAAAAAALRRATVALAGGNVPVGWASSIRDGERERKIDFL